MNILLLAPPYLDLYKDVVSELENQGHCVTYLRDNSFPNDPCLIRNSAIDSKAEKEYGERLDAYWRRYLKQNPLDEELFDVLLVINGKSYHPYLRNYLMKNNKRLKSILYLWDRCYKNYRFDKYIETFDKVLSFDKVDARELNLGFLPFYWVPQFDVTLKYDVSAFGTMRDDRYALFKSVYDTANKAGLKSFIKLYRSPSGKSLISRLKRLLKEQLFERHIDKNLLTENTLTPVEFRKLVFQSKCIIDTHNPFQEGMTPRFMWALGAGCKIITTNQACKTYPFYSEDFIFVTDDTHCKVPIEFLQRDYVPSNETNESVLPYRIDNWVKELLK